MTPQLPAMTPPQFIAKWRDVEFGEKQASQEMFLDLCALVGHPTPVAYGSPDAFTFEKWVPGGFADAYLEDRFGWEFKGSDDQLPGAFNQLLRYQVYLKTPPLLIVSSFRRIQIRTNFPGMETVLHEIPIVELEGFTGFYDLAGLGDLHRGTVPILIGLTHFEPSFRRKPESSARNR